jgi:hypothetical protein
VRLVREQHALVVRVVPPDEVSHAHTTRRRSGGTSPVQSDTSHEPQHAQTYRPPVTDSRVCILQTWICPCSTATLDLWVSCIHVLCNHRVPFLSVSSFLT